MTALVWYRNDLRLRDHQALARACSEHDDVIAVYCLTPEQWRQHRMSPMQIDLILRKLEVLRDDLQERNIPLLVLSCQRFDDSIRELIKSITLHSIDEVYFHRQYEWNEQQRDQRFIEQLPEAVTAHAVDDLCVLPPGSVLNQSGEMFKVFSPFRKKWLEIFNEQIPSPLNPPRKKSLLPVKNNSWSYHDERVDSRAWPVEEQKVILTLREFCADRVATYKQDRDFPAIDGSSTLSPYLALGFISPRQCVARLFEEAGHTMFQQGTGAFTWLNELIWREFYKHLLDAFPRLSKHRCFQAYTEHVVWDNDKQLFESWCEGRTGFPIVDAAMRQLNQTGWMHNRLRMIVASFLTKDLLVDWRWGEEYFSTHLIDWDLAANNGGWQWAASTGTDAQPYFRIFNPITQGERFDPDGAFVDQWVPELTSVPKKFKQTPWKWADKEGMSLDYPRPLVDHAERRKEAIARFEQAKNSFIACSE